MATGDNVLTAISVARQCNILDRKKAVWLAELTTDQNDNKQINWKKTDAYEAPDVKDSFTVQPGVQMRSTEQLDYENP